MSSLPTIPRDWIERYQHRISHSERGAIATMIREWDRHQGLEAQRLAQLGNFKARKVASMQSTEARLYFESSAQVWRAYNQKKISMTQRDKALWDLSRGIPVSIEPKTIKTPKQPIDIGDLL